MVIDTKTISKILSYITILLSDADLAQVINDFSDMNNVSERVLIQIFITKMTVRFINNSVLFRLGRLATSQFYIFFRRSAKPASDW